MSDRTEDPNLTRDAPTPEGTSDWDAIARLLKLAGPRPRAPLDTRERVRRAVHRQWSNKVTWRRRRRFAASGVGLLAAAAALALALGVAPKVEWIEHADPPLQVATLTATSGASVNVDDGSGTLRYLRTGDGISSQVWLETSERARAALELVDGGSLRLDRSTRVRFSAAGAVTLERGALYFDSGPHRADRDQPGLANLIVETAWGRVHDIGTQFEVRTGTGLRVRVREGLVNLDREGEVYEAEAGVELQMSAEGELSRRSVRRFGPEWDWVLDVARPFGLDGQPLASFLGWVSRETGREVAFAEPDLAATAPAVRIHGSIAGLRPDEALEAVLPTCGLTHRFTAGTLLIEAETH